MNAFVVVLVIVACGLLVPAVFGQSASPQDRAAALKASIAANQAALKQYSWIETTQISLKGEVKKTEQKQCYYGADGTVQKTPLPGGAPPPPPQDPRGLKGKVVEHKVEETKEYMAQVAALVHQYVPPDASKIKAAEAAGSLSVQPSPAGPVLTVKDYLKPGDSVAIGFDPGGKAIQSYKVTSYVQKPKDDDVSLNVAFASLPDGTSYPDKTVLDVPAKKIQVTVTNSGYKKGGL
jgi:hypothetical protein